MTNWDDEFTTPPPTRPTTEHDLSDFDAAMQDDWDASDFAPPEPEAPQYDETHLAPPFDLSGVDLLSPPGFVGDVAAWIDSQCRYPRRRLAVASAIVSVGNIGGLSHEDIRDGVTANVLAFCVAASSTGKEAVMQATSDLHRAAGIHYAMQGGIKSEQEITRNLIEHQAAFYLIDEIGIFLQKVKNAQKRGGATYLEGVFGLIMAAYSKANSRLLLNGDLKRELRKQFAAMVFQAEDNGDDDQHAKRMLAMVDDGLERPFLSIMGYTTPSTFDAIMDGEAATQGFVGRAIVISEKDINPDPREDYKKRPMPQGLVMRLSQLFNGGSFDIHARESSRVEFQGERIHVTTDEEADAMLRESLRWFLKYANERMEDTGEAAVALIRRAYELVAKVSFILAMPSRVRTAEHVRWAFAYVRQELDQKIALVFANDNSKDKTLPATAARIQGYIDQDKGTSASVFANRMKMRIEDIEEVLKKMEGAGLVWKEQGKRKYKGKPVVVWRMVE